MTDSKITGLLERTIEVHPIPLRRGIKELFESRGLKVKKMVFEKEEKGGKWTIKAKGREVAEEEWVTIRKSMK